MKREIKFRAWDGELMLYPNSGIMMFIDADGNYFEEADRKYDTPHIEIEREPNVEIMQYTGIKDRNVKEIYEGDIVLKPTGLSEIVTDKLGPEYSVYKKCDPVKAIVSYNGAAFCLGRENDPDYFGVIGFTGNCYGFEIEIIGNIYENPELLKS